MTTSKSIGKNSTKNREATQPAGRGRDGASTSGDNRASRAAEVPSSGAEPAGERRRDEQRTDGGPRYGGTEWAAADERGDQRYGVARNDDADPSELAPGEAGNDDDESPSAADPELAAAEQNAEIESGGARAGMHRGEKPRKSPDREPR
jgi:hypothetical protein